MEVKEMGSPLPCITDRVVDALLDDLRTRYTGIEVSCTQNVVILTGEVKSEAIRQTAVDITRRQPGVVIVVNELVVN